MKKLFVIRHAKSSWDHPHLSDKDRPLNSRGERDAPVMAGILSDLLVSPVMVYSSPANRAASTARIFHQKLKPQFPAPVVEDILYHGSEEDYLEVIQSTDEDYNTVVLFGHNPIIEYFMMKTHEGQLSAVPTCGVLFFTSDAYLWSELYWKDLKLVSHYFPKEI